MNAADTEADAVSGRLKLADRRSIKRIGWTCLPDGLPVGQRVLEFGGPTLSARPPYTPTYLD